MNSFKNLSVGLSYQRRKALQIFANFIQKFSSTSEEIVIPKRIQRGPTDILRALASTVQRDPTAAHYKYHDDPYLIPVSNLGKRSFALAKESGRKAAQWIRAEHSDLFQHKEAFPPIEAFYPKARYNEDSEVDEATLNKVIESVMVSDAITVYGLLEKKGINISDATKQSLLELVCFYNSEDTLPEDIIEERWFRLGTRGGRERLRKTWKDNGFAEKLFNSMENPSAEAYCTLLQGMTRFHQVDRAWQLYQQMKEKEIPLTTAVYNSLLRVTCYIRENNEMRWQLILDLLTEMSKQNLIPNIGTLNAILESMSYMNISKVVKGQALRVLSEMKHVGVEPSLATYYHLLVMFCKERGPVSTILVDIMKEIEGKTFEIRDPKDTYFFMTAMEVCCNHLRDMELAHRVNKLLHNGDNYNLIGDSYKESVYYRYYFMLLCSAENLETFMHKYNILVPHVYIPEPSVMEEIVKAVDLHGAAEHFPRLWSDMILFDQVERASLTAAVLKALVQNEPLKESELTEKFATIAWDAWTRLEADNDEEKYKQFSWTGQMLGDIITLCLRNDEFEKACTVLKKLVKEQHKVVGVPNFEALALFMDCCISNGEVNHGINCVSYSADAGFPETNRLAQQLCNSLQLNEAQLEQLTHIVGEPIKPEAPQRNEASN